MRRHTSCALVTGVQTCALPICSQYSRSLLDRRVPDRWVFRAVLLPAIDPENCGGTNAFRAVVLQCPDFLGTERTSGLEARPIVPACLVPATERESRSRIGRAHVGTPVTNAQLLFRCMIAK